MLFLLDATIMKEMKTHNAFVEYILSIIENSSRGNGFHQMLWGVTQVDVNSYMAQRLGTIFRHNYICTCVALCTTAGDIKSTTFKLFLCALVPS